MYEIIGELGSGYCTDPRQEDAIIKTEITGPYWDGEKYTENPTADIS